MTTYADEYTPEDCENVLKDMPSYGKIDQLYQAILNRCANYELAHAVCDYVEQKRKEDPEWRWPRRGQDDEDESDNGPIGEASFGKKRITMGKLRSMLSEAAISRILNEEDDSASHQEGESGDSLDSQVDRYLAQYEGDAKKADGSDEPEPNVDQMESVEWRSLVRGVILEAGEGDKDETADEDDAAPGAEGLTGEDNGKLGADKLDVEDFANSMVRMIDNYDSLLEVRNTLIRRAKTFLAKSYSDDVVKAFEDTLRDDHGLEVGKDAGETSSDKFPAPAADRANGSAEAGPGGGA